MNLNRVNTERSFRWQPMTPEDVKGMGQKQLKHLLKERAAKAYETKEQSFGARAYP
ncbi:MAG: hypothetical protein ACLU5B_00425 [Mediterraneibacter faecis]